MREAAPVAIDETRHGRHIDHALERVDSTRTEAERLLFAAYCLSESRLANGIMRSAALRRGALCVLRQDVHVQLTDPYGAVHTLRVHSVEGVNKASTTAGGQVGELGGMK